MKKIKLQTVWKAARILPWTILPTAIATLACFRWYLHCWQAEQRTADLLFRLFRGFYLLTIGGGFAVVMAEAAVLLMGLSLLIRRCRLPRAEREKSAVHWYMLLFSPIFSAGTLMLMLLVHVFTYGMSV